MSSSSSTPQQGHQTPQRISIDKKESGHHQPPAAAAAAVSAATTTLTPLAQQRQSALEEAQQVLDQVDRSRLDAFHLLGVVADPRGPAAASASNSYHGRYNTTNANANANNALEHNHHASASAAANNNKNNNGASGGAGASGGTSGAASYYYQQWESTLSQVTGQMEALNWMLEDWSRYIVEEGDAEVDGWPPSQLRELPAELAHLDTSLLEQYLAVAGPHAAAFYQILADAPSPPPPISESMDDNHDEQTATGVDEANHNTNTNNSDLVDVSDVPEIFFDPNFDLTQPTTFGQLLLDAGESTPTMDTTGPVHTWFPLRSPDALAGHLDKIELALLQQVRSHSGQFFAESQRFALLQEWIDAMLVDVTRLQRITDQSVVRDLLRPLQTVPVADAQRRELQQLERVLERAEDMILCKHGLGGVLRAAVHEDDLTAIEQIAYGRKLLEGGRVDEEEENDDVGEDTNKPPYRVELGRLHAFQTVAEQLNQYEQLVVSNVRDELVEIFLSWNSATTTVAVYGHSINTTTTAAAAGAGSQHQQQHAPPPPEHVRTRVTEISTALRRCRSLGKTKEVFATRLQDVTRMTVRTIVGEFAADHVAPRGAVQSVAMSTSSMTLPTFMDCLDMLFEQLLGLLTVAASVDKFLLSEGLSLQDDNDSDSDATQALQQASDESATNASNSSPPVETPLQSVLVSTAELMSKSISELLRIRKDSHALILLDEMKSIWDVCTGFANELEQLSGSSGITSALRSTLLAQAKAFVERKHESNMSGLAAALDSERWVQCEVSVERQDAMNRLCSGRSIVMPRKGSLLGSNAQGDLGVVQKKQEIEVEGTRYKVVWSCLLLIEMIMTNIATAAHFSSLASSLVGKISDLLRLFNSRTTQLVLGAGAIHSHAKLKSINAKHLSLVTQCLGMVIAILPHIRAALMAQLPKKQHTLLTGLDQIQKEYNEHNEKVLNKFVSIIGGIIEHGLAKRIPEIDFDQRAQTVQVTDDVVPCCVFLEGVSTNTRKMHQVLYSLLPPDHLKDTFSRIFAFIDTKCPALFIAAANIQPLFQKQSTNSPLKSPAKSGQPTFIFPKTDEGKRQFLLEVEAMTNNLNALDGVHPWEFTATNVLERRLEYSLTSGPMVLVEGDKTLEDPACSDEPTQGETGEASVEQPVVDWDNETQGDTGEASVDHPAVDSDNENTQQVVDEKTTNGDAESTDSDANEAESALEKKKETYDAAPTLPTAAVLDVSIETAAVAEAAASAASCDLGEPEERPAASNAPFTNDEPSVAAETVQVNGTGTNAQSH